MKKSWKSNELVHVKVDYNKVIIKQESKEGIDKLFEDGIPIRIENESFIMYSLFKVTICIISPRFDQMKIISFLSKWKRILIKNFQEETSGQSLLELTQIQQDLIIASDGSKVNKNREGLG